MTIIMAVSGKLGVGKDYIMEKLLLPKLSGRRVSRMAFADHIKVNVASQSGESIDTMLSGQKSLELRRKLQFEGTENGRDKYGEDIWINTLRNWIRLRELRDGVDIVVITDCRFLNEVNFIESMDGLLIRVVADDRNELALQQESGGDRDRYETIKSHLSETCLDDHIFKWVIHNEQGRTDQKEQLDNILGNYLKMDHTM